MSPTIPLRRSISLRLALVMVLLSVVVSAVAATAEAALTYRRQLASATGRLDDIGRSIVPGLASSLWAIDGDRVDLLMDALIKLPGTGYARLESEGSTIERGDPRIDRLVERTYTLGVDQGGHFSLGLLYVGVDRQRVVDAIVHESIITGLTTLICLLTAVLSMIILFRRWVSRPLGAMAAYASELTPDSLPAPLVLPSSGPATHHDEVGQMLHALHEMRAHLLAEYNAFLQREREQASHAAALEATVREQAIVLEKRTELLEAARREIQHMADTDSLTGVSHRRSFMQRMADEMSLSRAEGRPLSLLLLNVDRFREINYTYGHARSDRALAALAALLQICVRQLSEASVVGRLEGDEFGVLVPDADASKAGKIAESLREAIERAHLSVGDGGSARFTLSIGVSQLAADDDSPLALSARVRMALSHAKDAGRNRVHVDAPTRPLAS